eukprot:Protomagalhaensia_wolfi_Nauph_80__1527@NODE_192_length_3230_cov_101_865559_g145_i0_p1_GENE_NODE_192_length_3230_cov_101_865559_g145_i0NODE_192_length_3230_cov_101_865559_g145_i0_p1_ORF_typecomplete_len394_score76_95NTP_transferase/PF00483_23/4_1e50Hexapep/PF00132_24/3_3e09Hexapep/PF00132_24/0_0024Hexapep/PF00132_24/0_29NTP_transf_3/PF12804_7/7_4e10Hexapep_2/PF14602_6/0_00081Hexapep_2/PF14602_6/0_09DUF4954/PF16314_5/3e05Fucokinase/PF07959_12/6_2Fucokinase/PF07959_12/6Fucokinase/PF07959_12/18IspD/
MKALILVGGYGTRLRPLTLSVPKPLIHFCNRPIIEYQIRALVELGVNHVILAVAYRPDAMKDALTRLESKYGIRISCSVEEEPLLTAGPIRLAKDLIFDDAENEEFPELLFVFNSDVICEFPLGDVLKFHLAHKHEGTVCCTTVTDPSLYGVIKFRSSTGCIDSFIEKPTTYVGNSINAGLYLFNRSIVERIQPKPTSIEKEIFPVMAAEGELYCFQLQGYWADIGKPKDFLEGTKLYLQALSHKVSQKSSSGEATGGFRPLSESPVLTHRRPSLLSQGTGFIGNVLVHPSATIGEGCLIGPDVTIGPNCVIGNGVRLRGTALMANVTIADHSWVDNSIIGWNSHLGKWVRIEGLTVLGQDVTVKAECFINAAFILPYKAIGKSVMEAGSILM